MPIPSEVQQLNPGGLIEMFELDATDIGSGIIRFHGHNDGSLFWQGNEYFHWPMKAEGFMLTADQQPTPKLCFGNVDGSISALCLAFDDFIGAKITRRRTFVKYMDAVNFVDGNPTADPDQEFPPDIFFIERKATETEEAVEFELSSVLNFQGIMLPRRPIIADYCPAAYRGPLCGYTGAPVADAQDNPTSDPDLDRCGKKLSSCRLREWPDDVLNFTGFPAAGLIRQ